MKNARMIRQENALRLILEMCCDETKSHAYIVGYAMEVARAALNPECGGWVPPVTPPAPRQEDIRRMRAERSK